MKYFNLEPKYNSVFSRDNLPIIKCGASLINLDDRKCKETHWVPLLISRNTAAYYCSVSIKQNLR